jgi:CHASE2 domain-containing sensor protein/nitrogen-specific signal transduction histidine kinase
MSHDSARGSPADSNDDESPRRWGPEAKRYLIEWLTIAFFTVAIVSFCIVRQATAGLDRMVYDHLLSLFSRPAAPDIAIVDIDDESIATFGRWPWPRGLQARVLDAVRKNGAAAVVYDVLLTEPTPDDGVLADAIRAVPTYLPLLLAHVEGNASGIAVAPVGPFANAAAGMGHIELDADPDSVIRAIVLDEGQGASRWPYIDMLVYDAIRSGRLPFAHGRYTARNAPAILPRQRVLIPFGSDAPARLHVSAARLLTGAAAPGALRGKVVFVGVTAQGMSGNYATPVSGKVGTLSDVEVHAEVLDALLSDRIIVPAASGWVILASLLPLGVLLAGVFVLSPWRSLVLTLALSTASFAVSALLLHRARVWISPVPGLLGLLVLYPLWSWRRLEMTMSRLRRELKQLDAEPHLLSEPPVPSRTFGGDMLERQIALVERAARRLQDMKRFVWDSLNSVPEPVIVADRHGIVVLSNKAARSHFVRIASPDPRGRPLTDVLGEFTLIKAIGTAPEEEAEVRARWPAVLDPKGPRVGIVKRGLEVRDRSGHDYLLRYARCRSEQGEESGSWVAGLVEVTALHAAERGREDALRLLSHDMRSRHASILALVELERTSSESERTRMLLERIERHAHRALKLADDFVQLARAESQAYTLEPANLTDLVADAGDELWPQARTKGIRVEMNIDGEYWVAADRSLMTRAVSNVINNAIKYSPNNTVVKVSVTSASSRRVQCTVADEGYGIPLPMQRYLFEPFRRFQAPGQPASGGAGLGMAFIKTVVTRHGGEIRVESEPGRGTTVTIWLPAADETVAE